MKNRTVSFEEIDDRGKLRSEPIDESKECDPVAEASGEETAAGSNHALDEDVVEEIGKEAGITYADDEELRVGGKEAERDERRWELDPASAEDYSERSHPQSEGPAESVRHMNHHHAEGKGS